MHFFCFAPTTCKALHHDSCPAGQEGSPWGLLLYQLEGLPKSDTEWQPRKAGFLYTVLIQTCSDLYSILYTAFWQGPYALDLPINFQWSLAFTGDMKQSISTPLGAVTFSFRNAPRSCQCRSEGLWWNIAAVYLWAGQMVLWKTAFPNVIKLCKKVHDVIVCLFIWFFKNSLSTVFSTLYTPLNWRNYG